MFSVNTIGWSAVFADLFLQFRSKTVKILQLTGDLNSLIPASVIDNSIVFYYSKGGEHSYGQVITFTYRQVFKVGEFVLATFSTLQIRR
jgi:hypothetical protein